MSDKELVTKLVGLIFKTAKTAKELEQLESLTYQFIERFPEYRMPNTVVDVKEI